MTVQLTAGVYYPIQVEYKNSAGTASVVLKWSSPSLAEQVIPSTGLACVPGAGVSNTADLLSGLQADTIVTAGASGDYGWSWSLAPSETGPSWWYAHTNKKSLDRAAPVDLDVYFRQASLATAALTRDLGTPSSATNQWDLIGRINFEDNTVNHGPSDGQFLEVLDDAGKIIARFNSLSLAYPTDHEVFGNNVQVIGPTNALVLDQLMQQWQPIHITGQNGQVVFQYATSSGVTTPLFDATANWRRPKTLRLSYAMAAAAYTRAVALDDLTFTTVSAPLVTDTFTAANGTQLVGRAPADANVPGDVYARTGAAGWSTLVQGNAAELNADVGVSVSIASTASYTKPLTLTISGSLNPQAITGTQGFRGVGLGYYPAPGGGNGFTGFTGLALNPNGNLTLMENGTPGASVAYVGTWTANQMHLLSYNVDTRSGAISNVVLDGQSKSYTTTAFNTAATTRAGFYASAAVGGVKGLVDNFAVSAGP
jgi:hypothetical protein